MRILVVEDERRMAELLRRGLTEEGHSVTVAFDGREGLSMAQGYPFELIVLDVMHAHGTGIEVESAAGAGACFRVRFQEREGREPA